MKRLIIFLLSNLLIFAAPLSQVFAEEPQSEVAPEQQQFAHGQADGKATADSSANAKWLFCGFAGGLTLGPLGTYIVASTSQGGHPRLAVQDSLRIQVQSTSYRDGFLAGYAKQAKRQKLANSIAGGLVGTMVLGVIIAYVHQQTSNMHITGGWSATAQ